MVDEVLLAAIDASNSLGCILCGRETETVGVFVPDRAADYGVLPGCRFVYRICNDHLADRPSVQSRVERHIWKHQWSLLRGKRNVLDSRAKSR